MFIVLFILCLVALILVHEFGHFIIAKTFNIRVDEFGIFFPPRMFAKKFGETEYSINWLPFGGFVKIFGENAGEGKNDPRSFARKPRLVQAAVLLAGITFNLLFAWLLLSAGYMAGLPTSVVHDGIGVVQNPQVMIVDILPNSPAEKAGVLAGDVIENAQACDAAAHACTVEPQGDTADQVQQFITSHQGQSIALTVLRSGTQMYFVTKAASGIVPGRSVVGVDLDDVGTLKLLPPLALVQGAVLGWDITQSTATGLAQFFTQIFNGTANYAQVSGPIGITAFGAATIRQGFAAAVVLVALISINLALINLVPIPGLDGGRLLIVVVEGIIRRPVPERLVNILTIAGLALLGLLMLVVSYHDIAKLVG